MDNCHCEFTTVNVAIFMVAIRYEIASVVTFPCKDILKSLQAQNEKEGVSSKFSGKGLKNELR